MVFSSLFAYLIFCAPTVVTHGFSLLSSSTFYFKFCIQWSCIRASSTICRPRQRMCYLHSFSETQNCHLPFALTVIGTAFIQHLQDLYWLGTIWTFTVETRVQRTTIVRHSHCLYLVVFTQLIGRKPSVKGTARPTCLRIKFRVIQLSLWWKKGVLLSVVISLFYLY